MTFIVGRRRVGKTRLIKEAYKDKNLLYLFVSKKSESLLCDEYTRLISEKLGKKVIGKLSNFKEVFEYILSLGESEQINVAIDEFQEIYNINPSIFSDIQNLPTLTLSIKKNQKKYQKASKYKGANFSFYFFVVAIY